MIYEFRSSRLEYYPYLCVQCKPHNDSTLGILSVREYCKQHFGREGSKKTGRWHDGLLGFYFKDQQDAVQFILAWG